MAKKGPPPPNEPDRGLWRGQQIARVVTSPDGLTVLVGKKATDNDRLTFDLASPKDFWYHVSGASGSHVVVRNPDRLERLPKETRHFAAELAAGYSKARAGGRVAVHEARITDVSKPRGLPPGKVQIRKFQSLRVSPRRLEDQ